MILRRLCSRTPQLFMDSFSPRKPRPFLEKALKSPLDWQVALSDAERLVGHPTPYSKLVTLFNSDIAKTNLLLKKLVDSSHPVLRSSKLLLLGSKSALQSPSLILLLISKCAGINTRRFTKDNIDYTGILYNQRVLAEFVEMLRNSTLVTRIICDQDKHKSKLLISGRQLGDLSKNIMEVCKLNVEVAELVTSAVDDIFQSDLIGDRDTNKNPLPTKPKDENDLRNHHFKVENSNLKDFNYKDIFGQAIDEWSYRTMLSSGNLLANGCQAVIMEGGHDENKQRNAFLFGAHLAFCHQLFLDIKDFYINPETYSLIGAPVLFAIEEYPEIYHNIEPSKKGRKFIYNLDVHKAIRGTRALEKTRCFLEDEIEHCFELIEHFPEEKARVVLKNLVLAIYIETVEYLD